MEYKPNIDEAVERSRAFWNHEKVDRIPIRIRFPVGNLQAHESYLEEAAAARDASGKHGGGGTGRAIDDAATRSGGAGGSDAEGEGPDVKGDGSGAPGAQRTAARPAGPEPGPGADAQAGPERGAGPGPGPGAGAGASVLPWETLVQDPASYFAYWENQLRLRRDLPDDSVPTAATDLGPALMCGVMGAPITFEHGTSWSEHPLTDYRDMDRYVFDPANHWLEYIREMTGYFLEHAQGRFAVGLANYMGPSDIVTCLRGPTEVCLDFYEHPEELRKLLGRCTEAYLRAVNSQLDQLPRFCGGTTEGYMVWTPGRANWLAADITTVLSPQMYREFLLEYDQMVVDGLETCWMHVHSGGAFMAPEFLKLSGLRGVQIVNDAPAGPSLGDLVPILQQIQERHCLILRKFTVEEVRSVLPDLAVNRLFVDTQCGSLEEAQQLLASWHEDTERL